MAFNVSNFEVIPATLLSVISMNYQSSSWDVSFHIPLVRVSVPFIFNMAPTWYVFQRSSCPRNRIAQLLFKLYKSILSSITLFFSATAVHSSRILSPLLPITSSSPSTLSRSINSFSLHSFILQQPLRRAISLSVISLEQ